MTSIRYWGINPKSMESKCPFCGSGDIVKVIYGAPIPYKIWPDLPIGSIMMCGEGAAATHYCRACDHELWIDRSKKFIAQPPKDNYMI